ncbi:MAG: alanine racemase, partial [Bacteroidota bacterium]
MPSNRLWRERSDAERERSPGGLIGRTHSRQRPLAVDSAMPLADSSPLRAEIDLDAIAHNARVLAGLAGPADLLGVVKADAYGHGAVPVTRTLLREGVKQFAVASVGEAAELREAGIDAGILVFAAPLAEALPHYARLSL